MKLGRTIGQYRSNTILGENMIVFKMAENTIRSCIEIIQISVYEKSKSRLILCKDNVLATLA